MVDQLILPAPAKLNLFLHVTGQRPDGYHQLQTIFQFIDLADELHFSKLEQPELELTGDLAGVRPEHNLISKAFRLLQQKTGCQLGAKIDCQKNLPIGGGVGGGSSDAATTLVALNHLWGCGLSSSELQQLGLELGADVPIFIYGHAAWAEGVGEEFVSVEPPESCYLLLQPNVLVETTKIFTDPGLTRNSSPIKMGAYSAETTRNDLQSTVCRLYPEVKSALEWLGQYGPARMTGSGSVVFMACEDNQQAIALAKSVPNRYKAYVCRGCNISPLQAAIYWGVAKR